MVYPASVMGVAAVIMGVLLTYVVPTFEAMFMDFGGAEGLPPMTKFVVGISHGFIDSLPLIIGGGTAAFFGISASYQNPKGKRVYHWLELNLPALGATMKKIAVARFTRTLGTLLSSGVPIIEALTIVAKSSGNVLIEDAIMGVAGKISEGKTMAEPLGETGMFPSMVVQMIGVGEQTGAMDQMLNKIADFYEDEVDVAVAAMASLMEPVMMVGIGGMVGFMMVAMYMPIFDIAGKVKAE
jgi:type IV pilus assembly protein PilC